MTYTEQVKLAQRSLNTKHSPSLSVDGVPGPLTMAAMDRVNIPNWGVVRRVVGTIQTFAKYHNIPTGPIDGLWGPQTAYAAERLEYFLIHNRHEPDWRNDEGDGLIPQSFGWPRQTQADLLRFFGPVGQNQTQIALPYPMVLAWDTSTTVRRMTCHQKVARSLEGVLSDVLDYYGLDGINDLGLNVFGGGLNVRPIRGGSVYSTHAWGIAFDFDPENNQLRWGRDRAKMARPEYNTWFDIWEKYGAVSLGRKRNYDWMHVQFAQI